MPEPLDPDVQKFLTDPQFQKDRTLFNAIIDARMSHYAEEKKKADAANATQSGPFAFFDELFGRKPPQG